MRRFLIPIRLFFVAIVLTAPTAGFTGDISDLIAPKPWDTPRMAESKRILSGDPGDELALFGLSHGYYETARYVESERVYARMLELPISRRHYVESDRAIVLDRLNRTQEAEVGYRKAMEIMYNFPHPYAGLATMWIRRGERFDEAAALLSLAINYETSDMLKQCYRVQLGAARLGLGDVDGAIQILEECRVVIPLDLVRENYPINEIEAIYEVRYYLAAAYAKKGNLKAAERELDGAIRDYEIRRGSPPQARVAIMPAGTWEAIEHPDRFRYLFERWKLP